MITVIAIIHVIVAILLVVLVLMQDSKGGALGVLSGGSGSSTVWGSTGAGNILVTITRWLAIVFAATCITLAYMTTHKGGSVTDSMPAATAPAQPNPQTIDTSTVDQKAAPAKPAEKPADKK